MGIVQAMKRLAVGAHTHPKSRPCELTVSQADSLKNVLNTYDLIHQYSHNSEKMVFATQLSVSETESQELSPSTYELRFV